jgi:archaellin
VGGGDGSFTVSTFKDADSSSPVLNDPDDRLTVNFNMSDITGSNLGPGSEVTIELTTMAGGETSVVLNVPESLQGKSSVPL